MAQVIVDEALLREPNLWVPRKKPIGPVKVDTSHPVAESLHTLFLFPLLRNYVTGNPGSKTNTETVDGPDYVACSYSTGFALVTATELSEITSEVTIVFHGGQNGSPASGLYASCFGTKVSSQILGSRCGAHVPYTDGKVYWDFGGATEDATRESVAGLTVKDTDVWCFTAGPRGMEIWQNGVLRSSNSATPTRTNANVLSWGLGIHGTSAYQSHTQKVKSCFIFSKQLSSAQLASLGTDPYQFLIPA